MAMADPVPELDARFSDPAAVATPWDDTRRVIDEAELFWISTVRVDGSPHVTPLPAVWLDDALHFCTGAAEQKGVNLARNAHCTLTTGNNAWKAGLDVVIEGHAERITDEIRPSAWPTPGSPSTTATGTSMWRTAPSRARPARLSSSKSS